MNTWLTKQKKIKDNNKKKRIKTSFPHKIINSKGRIEAGWPVAEEGVKYNRKSSRGCKTIKAPFVLK